jgi:hypothetical protein
MKIPITFSVQYSNGAYYASYQNNDTGNGGSCPSLLTLDGVKDYVQKVVDDYTEATHVYRLRIPVVPVTT